MVKFELLILGDTFENQNSGPCWKYCWFSTSQNYLKEIIIYLLVVTVNVNKVQVERYEIKRLSEVELRASKNILKAKVGSE